MPGPTEPLRLGTRASPLARWQADWVATQLGRRGVEVELVYVATSGDRGRAAGGPPPDHAPATGLFTKEIQQELLAGRVDLAVHSLKDLPTASPGGLCLAAVPERAAVNDVLVSDRAGSFAALPAGATVGTGSLRRRAQLLHARGDLAIRDLAGNVETRLRKLHEGRYDAIVLAAAGLERLGLAREITQVLPLELLLPAVGQGALGIETRTGDDAARQAIALLEHAATRAAVTAERAMLAALEGGCLAPIAAWARPDGPALVLTGRVLGADGLRKLEATLRSAPEDAETLGRRVADILLAQGAAGLIQAARRG
jgi:hydroxymethylbilane synthase